MSVFQHHTLLPADNPFPVGPWLQMERLILGIMKGNRLYLTLLRTSEWAMARSAPILGSLLPRLT
jgi:hypothetical protein